jgi:hypothetical protein
LTIAGLASKPVTMAPFVRARPKKVHFNFELVDERRFGNGMVYLHYRIET